MNVDRLLPHDISFSLKLLSVLDRITQISLARENMDEVLSGVLDLVLEVFDADRAWFLYPCDPDASYWGVPMERARAEWPGLGLMSKEIPMSRDVSEILAELNRVKDPIQYAPHADRPIPQFVVDQFSVKSQLMISLRPKVGKTWVLGLHHCASEVLHDEKDRQLFTAIAYRISDTLSALNSTRQLRENEEKLRGLYELSPLGIALTDREGRFVEFNRAFQNICGYSAEELKSLDYWTVTPRKYQADEARQLESLRRTGYYGPYEKEHVHKDGSLISLQLSGLLISGPDGNEYIWSIVEDITGRKQAEEQLRKSSDEIEDLYNNAPCGYHSLDKDGIIRQINNTELAWLGFARDEVVGKMKWTEFLPPKGIQHYHDHFPRFVERGFVRDIECEIVRKDGTIFTGLISATAIYDASGDFVMSRSTVTDITGLKQAEQRLHNLAAHLQTVREEEKVGISRELHDDLGGTLTALKIEAHWLKTELSANQETIPLLGRAESMSQLINSATVAMRNIVTGLRPTILDDLGLLATLEWQAEQFQKRTGIKCLVNCVGDKGSLDKQHSIALFRISQEALTNVVRHSGASRVEIEFHHNDEEVVMSVIDNGRGMMKKRSDASIPYGIHGMCERVDQLGGRISFDIPPGGGLNVTVILPLSAGEAAET